MYNCVFQKNNNKPDAENKLLREQINNGRPVTVDLERDGTMWGRSHEVCVVFKFEFFENILYSIAGGKMDP